MNILEKIEKKKVLILGFGREGLSTYRFLRKLFPEKKLAFADKKELGELGTNFITTIKEDKNLTYHLGKDYLKKLDQYEIIIKTSGIPYKLDEVNNAKKKRVEFTSQTKIFFDQCKGKIIGVTGTKGKSTTTSLIYHILKEAKIPTVLLGNIGKPPLDYLSKGDRNTFFVFEMSSHQLMDIEKSPHIAVFLNIFPEHLDYYSNYEEYIKSKGNITRFQESSDFFIYNADFRKIEKIANKSKAKKYSFSLQTKVQDGSYVDKGKINFHIEGQHKFSFETGNVPLLGTHNLQNVMAAVIAAKIIGVGFKNIDSAIRSFKTLEGRLEIVGVYKSVVFVNDTLATIPEATIAALKSFKDKKLTLILGGFDRGISFDNLGGDLAKRDDVLNVILIGQTAVRIKQSLEKYKYKGKIYNLGRPNMLEVVKLGAKITPEKGMVLLSPSSTSFDMFKDYKDRGDQFKHAVLRLNQRFS